MSTHGDAALEKTGDKGEPQPTGHKQARGRRSVGGVWRASGSQCGSALELDFALLTSCTFPPVTKSKYIHTLKCTVIRSDLGGGGFKLQNVAFCSYLQNAVSYNNSSACGGLTLLIGKFSLILPNLCIITKKCNY